MRLAAPATVLLVVGLGLAASATAQRRPLLGTVIDEQGEPLAEAIVHGYFLPMDADSLAAADHVETTTDQRGRFRMSVYACSPYQLWVLGKADDDGKRPVSELTAATSGELVELHTIHRRGPSTAKIKGADKWQGAAPLTLRLGLVVDDAHQGEQRGSLSVPIDEAGVAKLPPLPADYVPYEIHDASGNLVYASRLRANKDDAITQLYEPHTVPLRVFDAKGAPLQGAAIRYRLRHSLPGDRRSGISRPSPAIWRTLGETDADGRLNAIVPTRHDPFEHKGWQHLFFLAEKHGLSSSYSGFSENPYFDGKQVDREGVTELRFTLREQKPLAGRLLRSADAGLAGQTVTMRFGIKVETKEGNGWMHESRELRAVTDQDGRFVMPDAPHEFFEANLLLDGATLREQLMPRELLRMTPFDAIALHRFDQRPAGEIQLALGTMPKLELQLIDQTGGPAAGADVLLISLASDDIDCDTWTPRATTDSAGRVAMLIEPGKWLLFARDGGGMSYQNMVIAGDEKLELRLQPMPAMRGRVVDGAGKPLADVQLDCHSASYHSNDNRDQGLEAIANNLNWHWIGETRTDADGNFACHFLDLDGMTYEARFRHDGKQSKDFRIETGEEPVTIVIE